MYDLLLPITDCIAETKATNDKKPLLLRELAYWAYALSNTWRCRYAPIPKTSVIPQELEGKAAPQKPHRKSRNTLVPGLQLSIWRSCLGPRKRRVLLNHCDPLSSHNKNLVRCPCSVIRAPLLGAECFVWAIATKCCVGDSGIAYVWAA